MDSPGLPVDRIRRGQYLFRPDREAKREFVRWAVGRKRWKATWDLGANTGDYSRLAAAGSEYVLSMERDSAAVDLLYRALRREGPGNILPLVVNLADPSPSLGWRCRERTSSRSEDPRSWSSAWR